MKVCSDPRTQAMSWSPAAALLALLLLPLGCDRPAPSSEPAATSSGAAASATASASSSAATSPSASAAVAPTASADAAEPVSDERARRVAQRLLFVDGHVDLPHRLWEGRSATGALGEDPSRRTDKGDFDYPRAKEGGLDAPFMSIYVPSDKQKSGGAKAMADSLIDLVEGLAAAHPDRFAIAATPADVERRFAAGLIALPLGIENGAALEGRLDNLAHFHQRGVRYITLTHGEDNDICDSSYDERHSHGGLTAFGRDVVAEMNRLGVMIDVSHVSDDSFWQVMDLSQTPVIASHSACRHYTPGFERNMSDEMIARLAERGGVIMINFGSMFLDAKAQEQSDVRWKARKAFMAQNHLDDKDPRVEAWNAEYKRAHPPIFATVEQLADHIEHAIGIGGEDHVGLGSDFDGVGDSLPTGLKDASQLPNLVRVLLERGFSEAQIAKIASGNLMRVWRSVEQHARERSSEGDAGAAP